MTKSIEEQFNRIAKRYDSRRKDLIPCFDDYYGTIIDLLPDDNQSPKILDIGAGTGLLTQMVYEKFPEAEITLIDIADEMLDVARDRFRGVDSISYVTADYTKHDFTEKFDIIVSALSIHHLTHEDKETLYRTCSKMLTAKGIFVNGDQFLGTTPENEELYQKWWVAKMREANLSDEEFEGWKPRTAMDKTATVSENLHWLEKAGFTNADIFYKNRNFGVIYGEKS